MNRLLSVSILLFFLIFFVVACEPQDNHSSQTISSTEGEPPVLADSRSDEPVFDDAEDVGDISDESALAYEKDKAPLDSSSSPATPQPEQTSSTTETPQPPPDNATPTVANNNDAAISSPPLTEDILSVSAAERAMIDQAHTEVADKFSKEDKVRVIVNLHDPVPIHAKSHVRVPAVAARQNAVLNAIPKGHFDVIYQYSHVPALAGYVTERGLEILERHPHVHSVTLDSTFTASINDAGDFIGAHSVQDDLGYSGEGVRVAVLDTGIDTDHPWLADDIIFQKCFLSTWWDPIFGIGKCPGGGKIEDNAEDDDLFDKDGKYVGGHGTHVSGIITAYGCLSPGIIAVDCDDPDSNGILERGIAPDAEIIAIKVMPDEGSARKSDIVAALNWLDYHHDAPDANFPDKLNLQTDIVNMSFGERLWASEEACSFWYPNMQDAIDLLYNRGIVIFSATGNDENNAKIGSPACLSNVISVGASWDDNTHAEDCKQPQLEPSADDPACFSNRNYLTDIFAPGVSILSSGILDLQASEDATGLANMSGTSQASPVAAGVAALMIDAVDNDPALTPDKIEWILENSTDHYVDDSAESGRLYPRVDARGAIDLINDDFDLPFIIDAPFPYTNTQSTKKSTTDTNDPSFTCDNFSGQGSHSVWYSYVPWFDGTAIIDTSGSDYDTVVAVWKDNGGSLEFVGCNNNRAAGDYTSFVQAPVLGGATYYVEVVGATASASGELSLLLTPIVGSVPVNDDFDYAITIDTNDLPYNNVQDVTNATVDADDPTFSCSTAGKGFFTIWYEYTPPANGTLIVDTTGSDFDTILAIRTYDPANGGSFTEIGCNDDIDGGNGNYMSRLETAVTGGTTYYIEGASFKSGELGNIDISVNFVTPSVGPLIEAYYSVDDNNSGASSGNGDNTMQCSETIELYVTLRNLGSSAATGVNATLSTATSGINITQANGSFSNIAPSGTSTNTSSLFVFTIDPSNPISGNVVFDLNITASNGGPWTDSFSIPVDCSNAGPVEYYTHAIDDDSSGGSTGNDDAIIQCGETVELPVTLRNQGNVAATDVNATISTANSNVSFSSTSGNYPDLAPGGTSTNLNSPFVFTADPATPHGTTVTFDLDISSSNGSPWTDSFSVTVDCSGTPGPLGYQSQTIDDDTNGDSSGNADGVAHAGETIELYVTLDNTGDKVASFVSATISTTNPYISLTQTTGFIGDIAAGGSESNIGSPFVFSIDPSIPDGSSVSFSLNITSSNGGPWTDSLVITVQNDCSGAEVSESECETLVSLYNSTNGANWVYNNDWFNYRNVCSWRGVYCTATGSTPAYTVTQLSYYNNNLQGTIPDLSALTNLQYISLSNNQLSGNIPDLSSLTDLIWIDISTNQLSGEIPDLSTLTNLERLDLSHNQLYGIIPALSAFTSIGTLYLNDNQLTGNLPTLPATTGDLRLYLNNNQLSGNIPNLSSMPNLWILDLSNNQLDGSIPDLSTLTNLSTVNLANNELSGNIPALSTLTSLRELDLSDNQLNGSIPALPASLDDINLANNQLSENIPALPAGLSELYLQNNQLSGEVPSSITGVSFWQAPNISYNELTASGAVATYLDTNAPGWETTQTVAPQNVSMIASTRTTATLTWTPIAYAGDGGYYKVYYSETLGGGGGYTFAGNVSGNKTATSYTVTGLLADTQYYFVIKTYTPSHGNQQNNLTSDYSTKATGSTATNTLPVANTDSLTVDEDSSGSVDVLFNDSDADGDTIAIDSVGTPTHGTAQIDNNGTIGNPSDDVIVYTPAPDYAGSDSFTYVVADGVGGTSIGTVNVTVDLINDAPNMPNTPSPIDSTSDISIYSTVLGWAGGDMDTPYGGAGPTYDVYFDTNATPTTLVCNDAAIITCTLGTLQENTTYYWYVVADDGIAAPITGSIWSFTTSDFCGSQSEIPASECTALLTFYNNTNGSNWTANTNWFATATPCSSPWYGLTCSGDHVVGLNLPDNALSDTALDLNGLTSLTTLNLSGNFFAGVFPDLSGLTTLTILDLSNNAFTGNVPDITSLTALTTLDVGYNALNASGSIKTFLDVKDPDWANTQTATPTGLSVVETPTTSNVELSWVAIPYSSNNGFYEISYALKSTGPWTVAGTTVDKNVTSYTVNGLPAERIIYFQVRTYTASHGSQQNNLWSEYTAAISAKTASIFTVGSVEGIEPDFIDLKNGSFQVDLVVTGAYPLRCGGRTIVEKEINGQNITISFYKKLSPTRACSSTSTPFELTIPLEGTFAGGTTWYLHVNGKDLTISIPISSGGVSTPNAFTITGVSETQVGLSWDDVATETAYHIERSDDSGATWSEIATVAADVTSYLDTGLICNISYDYRIRAFRSGDSQYSAYTTLVTATTTVCLTTLLVDEFSDAAFDAGLWTSASNGGGSVSESGDYLRIDSGTVNGGGTWAHSIQAFAINSKLTIFETTLYTTSSDGGAWGLFTASDYVLFGISQTGELQLHTRTGGVTSTTTVGAFDATVEHTYRIEMLDNSIKFYVDNVLVGTETTTIPVGPAMQIRLDRVSRGSNQQLYVNRVEVKAELDPPSMPTNFTANASSDTQVDLSWDDVATETAYHIERSDDSGTTWAEIAMVAADLTSYSNTGLTCDTSYDYRIRAFRSSDSQYSAYTASTTATTTDLCDGVLDLTYGSGGSMVTDINSTGQKAFDSVLQSDGKLVVSGSYNNAGNWDSFVARYNTDGSLDTSFGSSGYVTFDVGNADFAKAVAIQADGKIVVGGEFHPVSGNADYYVARLTSAGVLDTSFDTDGIKTVGQSNNDHTDDIVLQSDGKIIIVGQIDLNIAALRFNIDGSLDTSFGGNGIVSININGTSYDSAMSVALQSNGKIIIVGNYEHDSQDYDWALVRLNTDGTLDTSFDTDGKIPLSYGGQEYAAEVAILDNDKIVTLSLLDTGSTKDYAVSRFNADGSVDTSFGTNGKIIGGVGAGDDLPRSLALLSDGKILVIGRAFATDSDIFVVRYLANGIVDTSFGTNGTITIDFGPNNVEHAANVVVQSDGKVIVVGYTENGSTQEDIVILRYTGSVGPLRLLFTPTNLIANTLSNTQINLSWDDVTSETAYHIERSDNSGTTWAEITTVAADAISYSDTGLTCNTSYDYRLRAYRNDDNKYSSYTASISVLTDVCVTILLVDEFNGSSLDTGMWDWTPSGGTNTVTGGSLELHSGANNLGYSSRITSKQAYTLSSTPLVLTFRARSSVTTKAGIVIGFTDIGVGSNLTYFSFYDGNDDMRAMTGNGTLTTDVFGTQGTTYDLLLWHEYRIEATTTEVKLYIDDVLVSTITTNIPTAPMWITIYKVSNTANDEILFIDRVELIQ